MEYLRRFRFNMIYLNNFKEISEHLFSPNSFFNPD